MRALRFLLVLCVFLFSCAHNTPVTKPDPPAMTWKEYLRGTDSYQWDNNAKSGVKGLRLWAPGLQWRI
jgi:hypothetical protein